jgi:hypothetical protein
MRGANPYQTTPNNILTGLTCGQWVAVPNHVKPGRFVRYNADGTAFVVHPTGKGKRARVNMGAFRLACQKPLADVIATAKVESRIVNLPAVPEPVGPAEDREAALQAAHENENPGLDEVISLLADFF